LGLFGLLLLGLLGLLGLLFGLCVGLRELGLKFGVSFCHQFQYPALLDLPDLLLLNLFLTP
jgi:hypothetical protein